MCAARFSGRRSSYVKSVTFHGARSRKTCAMSVVRAKVGVVDQDQFAVLGALDVDLDEVPVHCDAVTAARVFSGAFRVGARVVTCAGSPGTGTAVKLLDGDGLARAASGDRTGGLDRAPRSPSAS